MTKLYRHTSIFSVIMIGVFCILYRSSEIRYSDKKMLIRMQRENSQNIQTYYSPKTLGENVLTIEGENSPKSKFHLIFDIEGPAHVGGTKYLLLCTTNYYGGFSLGEIWFGLGS